MGYDESENNEREQERRREWKFILGLLLGECKLEIFSSGIESFKWGFELWSTPSNIAENNNGLHA